MSTDPAGEVIIPTDLSGYVPYTGATTDVDLGSNNLTTTGITTLTTLNPSVGGLTFRRQDYFTALWYWVLKSFPERVDMFAIML
jgi:hypothetical protein